LARTLLTLDSLAAAPWALDRSVLAEWVGIAERGGAVAAAPSTAPAQPRTQGVVAIIPIHGAIERRSSFLGELFGSTSIEALRASIRGAVADPDVKGIVLSIDSPGGAVAGVTELAAEIREARRYKPVIAHADTVAASAAYWLGSQADEFVVTPSGQVGSVGVYAVHQDISGALAAEGVSITIISAGDHKVDGNEFEPLSDEARGEMQSRVDSFYGQFVDDIAKGRGVSPETVRKDYGQGRMLLAKEALAAGIVDAVDTLDGTLRRVARAARASMAAADLKPDIHADEDPLPLRARLADLVADTEAIVAHVSARAELRAKEGRRTVSTPIEASLRTIRDAIDALLPVEPPAAPPVAVEPPPAAPAAPVTPRFGSRAEFVKFMEAN
jgi:signal peptide peptidase SppA